MRFETILFDLDGTVVDSGAIILASRRHATRQVLGRDYSDEELLQTVGGPGLEAQMEALAPEHVDRLVDVYRAHNEPLHDELEACAGMGEVLVRLKEEGRRLGVVTAKRRSTTELAFASVPLGHLFETIVGGDETDRHKPDPEPLLVAASPERVAPDSPTQRVGAPPSERFQKVGHLSPMGSLDKVTTDEAIVKWADDVRKRLGNDEPVAYVLEPKIDGSAINLVYEHGRFVRGATRGDGVQGEDVTPNLRTIRAIPLQMRLPEGEEAPPLLEVRGEVYMPLSGFREFNERLAREGKATAPNPRNAAAGSLRQKDSGITAQRPLSIWVYGTGRREGLEHLTTHWETLQWLRAHGFRTNPYAERVESVEEIAEACRAWERRRTELDYEIDGIVIKVDSFEQQ